MKKFRIRTKVSFILILSLLIVETIFLFPSLKNRRTQLVNEQITKLTMVSAVLSEFLLKDKPEPKEYQKLEAFLRKFNIRGISSSDEKTISHEVQENRLNFQGNGLLIKMDLSWIEDEVNRYARNIIFITFIIILSVTGVAWVFLFKNKTIKQAEDAELLAKELETKNIAQNKKLTQIFNSSLKIASGLAEAIDKMQATSSELSDITQKQAASLEELSASFEEVSAATDQISERAGELLSMADKASSTMETLSSKSKNTAEQSITATSKANLSLREAKKGEHNVSASIASMNEIQESTNKVTEILAVISDISDRVNLLSLNAAIEAARAGESGRGFAVVADEIGKLADQTAQSTKDITILIQLENDRVVTGSNMVGKLTSSFYEINKNIQIVHNSLNEMLLSAEDNVNSSNELSGIINQFHVMTGTISRATQEQADSGKEISSNVEFINNRVQTVAQTAKAIADTISGLTDQAKMLKQMISDTAISEEEI